MASHTSDLNYSSSFLPLNSWLRYIDDETPLVNLFLPGTHDTMTSSCTESYYKTQNLSLAEQLDTGVRFLDIRLRKEMVAAHREWVSNLTFDSILSTIKSFFLKNPYETIIMRIQNANELKDDYPEYIEALHKKISTHLDMFYQCTYKDSNDSVENFQLPTLGAIRGKIFALECSPLHMHSAILANIKWALPWHNNSFLEIQDNWDGPSIEDKKCSINDMLNVCSIDSQILRINHISATNGQCKNPLGYASKLNPFFLNAITTSAKKYRGIQIFDFINSEITRRIIELNKKITSHIYK